MRLGYDIQFKALRRIHIFKAHAHPYDFTNEIFDHKEYATLWRRYMPNLSEVALLPNLLFTKTGPKNSDWTPTVLNLTEVEREHIPQQSFVYSNASNSVQT